MNIKKSNYLLYAGNKRIDIDVNLKISGENIVRADSVKYLGVLIDHNISWKDHITFIHSKISRALGIVHAVKHLLVPDTLITLYYTIIYPHLHYCNVIWGMANITTMKPLHILQKRIIRVIANVNYDSHTADLFKSFKMLKVRDIYNLECLKLIHYQLNTEQSMVFHSASQIHNINTRNRNNLRPSFPVTEAQRRFVMYYGCMKWNELPHGIKTIDNKDTFKITTKKHLLSSY